MGKFLKMSKHLIKQALSPKTIHRALALRAKRLDDAKALYDRQAKHERYLIDSANTFSYVFNPFSTRSRRIRRADKRTKEYFKAYEDQFRKWSRTRGQAKQSFNKNKNVAHMPTLQQQAQVIEISSHPKHHKHTKHITDFNKKAYNKGAQTLMSKYFHKQAKKQYVGPGGGTGVTHKGSEGGLPAGYNVINLTKKKKKGILTQFFTKQAIAKSRLLKVRDARLDKADVLYKRYNRATAKKRDSFARSSIFQELNPFSGPRKQQRKYEALEARLANKFFNNADRLERLDKKLGIV